jgi:hypothetical protein
MDLLTGVGPLAVPSRPAMGAIGDLSLFKADRCEAVFLYPHALQAGIDRAKAKGMRFGRKPVLAAGKRKVLA